MLGFTRLSYLGGMSERIAAPRTRTTPHRHFPAAPSALAGSQTGIYLSPARGLAIIGQYPCKALRFQPPQHRFCLPPATISSSKPV
jgi:allophanate hydrolase subunit 1